MTASELKKIGIDPKNYGKVRPEKTQKKGEKKKDPFSVEIPDLLEERKRKGRKRKKKDDFGLDLF